MNGKNYLKKHPYLKKKIFTVTQMYKILLMKITHSQEKLVESLE